MNKKLSILLLFLSIFVVGCGKNDFEPEDNYISEKKSITTDSIFSIYISNYKDIEYKFASINQNDTNWINLSGLRNSHLWLCIYNKNTKNKVLEWEDTDITKKEQKEYLGYGNYRDFTIEHIYVIPFLIHNEGFIGQIYLTDLSSYHSNNYILFYNQNKVKKIPIDMASRIKNWYKESIIIENCCYTYKGDTIYTLKRTIGSTYTTPLSYEEGISISNMNIIRDNFRTLETVWSTKITSSFGEPSNSKYTYELLENTTNLWKYKVYITYYDGTKKDLTFTINIENGKIEYL